MLLENVNDSANWRDEQSELTAATPKKPLSSSSSARPAMMPSLYGVPGIGTVSVISMLNGEYTSRRHCMTPFHTSSPHANSWSVNSAPSGPSGTIELWTRASSEPPFLIKQPPTQRLK